MNGHDFKDMWIRIIGIINPLIKELIPGFWYKFKLGKQLKCSCCHTNIKLGKSEKIRILKPTTSRAK